MAADVDADQPQAFDQRQIDRQRRDRAIGEAGHKMASAPGQRTERAFGHIADCAACAQDQYGFIGARRHVLDQAGHCGGIGNPKGRSFEEIGALRQTPLLERRARWAVPDIALLQPDNRRS